MRQVKSPITQDAKDISNQVKNDDNNGKQTRRTEHWREQQKEKVHTSRKSKSLAYYTKRWWPTLHGSATAIRREHDEIRREMQYWKWKDNTTPHKEIRTGQKHANKNSDLTYSNHNCQIWTALDTRREMNQKDQKEESTVTNNQINSQMINDPQNNTPTKWTGRKDKQKHAM